MSASQVIDLCNAVLVILEKETLATAVDLAAPATPDERVFAARLDNLLRALAAEHAWNCFRKRAALTEDPANPPAFGFARRYPYPSAVARICSVGLDGCWRPGPGWYADEDHAILTDAARVEVTYTWYPWRADYATAELWDAAIGAYLDGWHAPYRLYAEQYVAYHLCKALGGSNAMRETLERERERQRIRALAYDRAHDIQGSIYSEELIWARLGE